MVSPRSTFGCRFLVSGEADAPVLALSDPLSLWGGVDPGNGTVIDHRHPQAGRSITGRIVVMERSRGSSSASSVLAEMIRIGTAPAGFVLVSADPILVLGAVVADELYGRVVPVAIVTPSDLGSLERADTAYMDPGAASITVRSDGPVPPSLCR